MDGGGSDKEVVEQLRSLVRAKKDWRVISISKACERFFDQLFDFVG